MAARYKSANVVVGHVISIALDDSESSRCYRFSLINLCFGDQVIPNWGGVFQYWPDYPGVEME